MICCHDLISSIDISIDETALINRVYNITNECTYVYSLTYDE